ncbi:unnamed protein product [Parnassius mnemosyne]|uniref:Peptidase A2 domain-containing protein n=1 Tax=Parnassius mnemosyne TaxID=213953 RepID=A0AAV1LCJ2_9NEOP
MDQYDEVQYKIELIDNGQTKASVHDAERDFVENRCFTIQADIEKLLTHRNSTATHREKAESQVRLPKLKLPTFDGNLKEWPAFKNLFMCSVDSANIPTLQKFQYLKTSVKGEAAGLINSLLIIEENYNKALELLTKRYENKTIIVNHHLKSFINFPTITRHNLKQYLTVFQQSLDSLRALGVTVDSWDLILVYLITQNLDNSLRASWEISRKDSNIPTLEELLDFLNLRVTAYDLMKDSDRTSPQTSKSFPKLSHVSISLHTKPTIQCVLCQNAHVLYKCPNFLEMPVDKRIDFIKANSLCFNCLQPFTFQHKCSKSRCALCHKMHYTTIHMQNPPRKVNTVTATQLYPGHDRLQQTSPTYQSRNDSHIYHTQNNITDMPHTPRTQSRSNHISPIIQSYALRQQSSNIKSPHIKTNVEHNQEHIQVTPSTVLISNSKYNQILLPTAIVKVQDSAGRWHSARALLDSGSEVNIITHRLASLLNCKYRYNHHIIQGIGESNQQTQLCINTNIASYHTDYKTNLKFIVMNNITVPLPHSYIQTDTWNIPYKQSKFLADPQFYMSKEIDLLLGAGIFYDLLLLGHIRLGPNRPHLIETVLGWVVSGTLVVDSQADINNSQVYLHASSTQTRTIRKNHTKGHTLFRTTIH